MAKDSQTEGRPSAREVMEAQLRECFGRVVYSHKTHEKCADILLSRLATIKLWQIILSSLTTAGFLTVLLGEIQFGALVGLAVSATLLALNTYTKDYDLGELAQKHRQSAADIWLIREEYLSALTDLRAGKDSLEKIAARRDELLERLHAIYSGAPNTTFRSYKRAQSALQREEDMTFSNAEINAFLPTELHK